VTNKDVLKEREVKQDNQGSILLKATGVMHKTQDAASQTETTLMNLKYVYTKGGTAACTVEQ
jgi:hypothetical protein